jgi:hypothetical protein
MLSTGANHSATKFGENVKWEDTIYEGDGLGVGHGLN